MWCGSRLWLCCGQREQLEREGSGNAPERSGTLTRFRAQSRRRSNRLPKFSDLLLKERSGENRLSVRRRNLLFELDPRLASAARRQHRKVSRRGQSKYTQRQGINVLAPAPIEALSDYFIAPNMLTAQRARCLRADQFMPLDNFCEKFDS